MSEKKWLETEIKDLEEKSKNYEEKAFFQALLSVVNEQYKRIEQAEGELDGTLWSPNKW